MLVTWGGEDVKRIVFDTRMHKLDDTYWMAVPYFDLLKGYIRFKNVTNDVSVEAALVDLNIVAEGSAHRALDDARMTAEVFRTIFAELDFDRKQVYVDMYTNAKERRLIKTAVKTITTQKGRPNLGAVRGEIFRGQNRNRRRQEDRRNANTFHCRSGKTRFI